MLRSLVEKTVRYARRLVGPDREERATATCLSFETNTRAQNHFDRSVRMLRREIVRAVRKGELELKHSGSRQTFRTSAKNLRTASGYGRSEMMSFVNAVCYAVTREVGAFPLPLFSLE